jgi:peptidoglycan/LPS O-acetylase OafA/YrhL
MTDRPGRGPKEIRALTGLRGIAAIWVMVFHTMSVPESGSTVRAVLDRGYLAVDLFFVLSGYVLALNYGRLFRDGISRSVFRTFLWRRFARTYPLYFVMTVVVLALSRSRIIALWDGGGQVCNASASALIPNLLLVQSRATHFCSLDAPSWSISTEWGAYLLFPFLSSILLFGPKTRLWASAVVAVGVLDALRFLQISALGGRGYWFSCLNIWDTVSIAPELRCVAEFTIGLVVFRLSQTDWGVRVGTRAWP